MSYKTEFANNNVDLQSILNSVNNLGDGSLISGSAENLDEELATQDSLISQISTALEGKGAGAFNIEITDVQTTTPAKTITLDAAVGKNNLVAMMSGGDDPSSCYARFTGSGESTGIISSVCIIDGVCVSAVKTYFVTSSGTFYKDVSATVTWDASTGTLTTTDSGQGWIGDSSAYNVDAPYIRYFAW